MPNILCGHCGNTHGSIAEVRECSITRPITEEPPIASRVTRPEEVLSEGFYMVNDSYYKVIESQNARLYAKRLSVGENGEHEGWDYAPGAIKIISPEHRMTREQAATFGQISGVCLVCGRKLTDETSIANGIGPICMEKF